jgi:hypothetical protein
MLQYYDNNNDHYNTNTYDHYSINNSFTCGAELWKRKQVRG